MQNKLKLNLKAISKTQKNSSSNNNQAPKSAASIFSSEGSDSNEEINCPGIGLETLSDEETKNQRTGLKRDESVINLEKEANQNALAIFKSSMRQIAKLESLESQIMTFLEKENPVANLAKENQLTPRARDFEADTEAYAIATCLSKEAQRWKLYIKSFQTTLVNLQHAIRQLKQDSHTLDKKFKMLIERDQMIKSGDFENEFNLLDESLKLFQSTTEELKKTSKLLTWEVHDYEMHQDDNDLTEEQKEKIKDKKDCINSVGNLTKGKYDDDYNEQLQAQKVVLESKQKEADREGSEFLKSQKEQNDISVDIESIKIKIEALRNKVKEQDKLKEKLLLDIAADEQHISSWKGNLDALDQSNLNQTSVITREQTIQEAREPYEQQIQDLKASLRQITEQIASTGSPDTRIHFTFICDSSGSMSTKDYNAMMAGVEGLIAKRVQSNCNLHDRFSIVQFGTTAELVESDVPITKPFVKPTQWGYFDTRSHGTNFNEAFRVAIDQIKIVGARNHFVLFLTDGHGSNEKVHDFFNEQQFLNLKRNMKSFHCFCIGYSKGYSLQALNEIATIANGQTFKFFDDQRIDYVNEADQNNVVQQIGMLGRVFELELDSLKLKAAQLEEQIDEVEHQEKAECKRRGNLFDEIEGLKNQDFNAKKDKIQGEIDVIQGNKASKSKQADQHQCESQRLRTNEITPLEVGVLKQLEEKLKLSEENTKIKRDEHDKILEQLKKLKDALKEHEKAGQEKALQNLLTAEIDQKQGQLAKSHAMVKDIQAQVARFILQVEKQTQLILRFTKLCVNYVKDKGFLDYGGGLSLPQFILSNIATHFSIPHRENDLKYTSNIVFGKVIRAMLTQDDPSEDVEDHVNLLKNNFDFEDFVYECFDLKNPLKKKAKPNAAQEEDDDDEPETLESIASKHFQTNIHKVWKKEYKKFEKKIKNLEDRLIPRAEEALEKAEEKDKQKEIDKAKANLDGLEGQLKKEEDILEDLENKEEKVLEQQDENKEKFKDFKRNTAKVKKLIMKVGCLQIQQESEARIYNCFKEYKEGVFPALDQLDDAIPMLSKVMDSMK